MALARLGGYNAGQPLAVTQSGSTRLVRRFGNVIRVNPSRDGIEGRTHVFQFPDAADIASVEILTQPAAGRVSVRADKALAYVTAPGDTGVQTFSARVTYTDAQVGDDSFTFVLEDTPQQKNWGDGLGYYYLPKDGNGRVIVEPGDSHRKFYVATDGMDAAAIASHASANGEPGTTAGDVTHAWMVARPQYGGSEALAITPSLLNGLSLWQFQTQGLSRSHHLLFKRGQTFSEEISLVPSNAQGQSLRHPLFIGAWGTGAAPVLEFGMTVAGESQYVVAQDLVMVSSGIVSGSHTLHDKIHFTGGSGTQNNPCISYLECRYQDIWADVPKDGASVWRQYEDRRAGFYGGGAQSGILLENCFFDICGWNPSYVSTTDAYPASPGMGPGIFSHCAYFNNNGWNITVRGCVFARGAFGGLKMRSGGLTEDCVFIENGSHFSMLGGNFANAGPIGEYGIANGNVMTSALYETIQPWTSGGQNANAYTLGGGSNIQNPTGLDSVLDNIMVHLANPNDATEMAARAVGHRIGLSDALDGHPRGDFTRNIHTEGNRQYNWGDDIEIGVSGLSTATMDATTVQNWFDAEFSMTGATIQTGLAQWRLDDRPADRVASFLAYFRDGFDVAYSTRSAAATMVFSPNEACEGLRWDNRMNWPTNDLAGRFAGDAVDLAGNTVHFGLLDTAVASVDLRDGLLRVDSGRLVVNTALTSSGATLSVQNCGWLAVPGYTGSGGLDVTVSDGGRLENRAAWTGASDVTVTGGQAILAQPGGSFTVPSGSTLDIRGGQVGFDGTGGGAATITVNGTLTFTATGGALGRLAEFRSGMNGTTAPDVASTVALNGGLTIDVTGVAAGNYDLVIADTVTGSPTPTITGGSGTISYATAGKVILTVT
jgi:hypothetical protein